MCKIVTLPSKSLRERSKEVDFSEVSKKELEKLFDKMSKALSSAKHGVAIAAPQIGVNWRVFVVSGKALEQIYQNHDQAQQEQKDKIYINPKLVSHSSQKQPRREGCLSVPGLYGEVNRYKKVAITYYDLDGKKHREKATGFLAQIFQHELDHLDGILYIDKAEKLFEVDEDFNIKKRIK